MFKLINEMLLLDKLYGISKEIDIAKGVNKYPNSVMDAFEQAKRKLMSNNDKKEC